MRKILAAISLYFIGCSPLQIPRTPLQYTHQAYIGSSKIINVYVDQGLENEEDKKAIDDAINQWNYVFNGQIILMEKPFNMEINILRKAMQGEGILLMPVTSSCSFIPEQKSVFNWTVAWTDVIGGHKIFIIRDRIPNEKELTGILLHELGHAFGVRHSANLYSLMTPVYNEMSYHCIDRETAFTAARFEHLKEEGINFCF